MSCPKLTDVIGAIPYRVALAGGWIDQAVRLASGSFPARCDGRGWAWSRPSA